MSSGIVDPQIEGLTCNGGKHPSCSTSDIASDTSRRRTHAPRKGGRIADNGTCVRCQRIEYRANYTQILSRMSGENLEIDRRTVLTFLLCRERNGQTSGEQA
jgi:hypothetical protein